MKQTHEDQQANGARLKAVPDAGEAEDQIAAKIRPLPDDVRPSSRFLERLRLRLLTLPYDPGQAA